MRKHFKAREKALSIEVSFVAAICVSLLALHAQAAVLSAEKAPARQPVVVEDSESERAVRDLASSKKLKLGNVDQRHTDGVKGYKTIPVQEGPDVGTPDKRTAALAHLACNASVFGLATLENAKSFVGKGEAGVFTKLRFRVIRDWRADAKNKAAVVHLIIHGGELVHAGERVRVESPLANYKIDSSYILAAGARSSADHGKTIYELPPFVEVENNLIFPTRGWDVFAAGTTVNQAQADVAQAVAAQGCK
jgi:hypothetical protein